MAIAVNGYGFDVPEVVTPEEALSGLQLIAGSRDREAAHVAADQILVALLRFYGTPEGVIAAYNALEKWCG